MDLFHDYKDVPGQWIVIDADACDAGRLVQYALPVAVTSTVPAVVPGKLIVQGATTTHCTPPTYVGVVKYTVTLGVVARSNPTVTVMPWPALRLDGADRVMGPAFG
jgi:hypothetical protein